MPIKNRNLQIPGGFRMYQPEIKWQSNPWASFNSIVSSVISARAAHPEMVKKYNWSLDPMVVAEEVDRFNTILCQKFGWDNYIVTEGASPPPKSLSPQQADNIKNAAGLVKKIWNGLKVGNDWLDSGEPAVDLPISAKRAAVCIECPLNSRGSIAGWFTKPAAEVIRKQLERVKDQSLSTPYDDKLNICKACECVLKLKVHTPLKFITPHLKPEAIMALRGGKSCWILSEMGI